MKSARRLRGSVREYGRELVDHLLVVIGAFVTIVTFFIILSSQSLRTWIKVHPYPIFVALVIVTLIAILALNHARLAAKRTRTLNIASNWRESDEITSPEAHALLELLAFFGPEPIYEDLLLPQGKVQAPTEYLQKILTDSADLRRAADELSRLSLAQVDSSDNAIRIQPIAQALTRGQISLEDPQSALSLKKLAQSILAASDPNVPDRDDSDELYRESRKHLLASGALQSPDPLVRRLVINQVRRLYRSGGYLEGVALGEASLNQWQETFGSDDHQTLALAVEVGAALRRLGRWEDAMKLNTDTLLKLKKTFGINDPTYLLCAMNHGIDLALQGDYAAALKNDLGLVPLYEKAFGENHLDTLQMRNNAAVCLRCLGRYKEALEMDEKTCGMRRAILGAEDTGTLTSRFAIARDLRMLGQMRVGHDVLVEVDQIIRRKFTVSRQFRLLVGGDLAISLRRCGHHKEAANKAELIFSEYNSAFGPDHRDTLHMGVNLINDRRIANRLSEARTLGHQMVAAWTKTVNADHPNTLAAQANLAGVLRAEGNAEGALQINAMVMQKLSETFGDAHPSTLIVLTNLVSDMSAMGETHEARLIGERSYQLQVETLGQDHPFTLATAANLSLDRRLDGDRSGADELHKTALQSLRKTLGHEHPDTWAVARRGRLTLDIEPMMD